MPTQYTDALSKFQFGDMLVEYLQTAESQTVGLRLSPAAMVGDLATRREFLDTHEVRLLPNSGAPLRAWQLEPLVQFKLAGDSVNGYSQGITLRNSDSLASLRFTAQNVLKLDDKTEIITTLSSDRGYACEHHLI
jgi:hypothetical protein